MSEIGIRELKQRASQILREVREKGQTYTVTYQGRPCGLLLPHAAAKRKGKGAKAASLRGIWQGGPEIPWEELLAAKKLWTAPPNSVARQLAKTGEGKGEQGG